MSSGRAYYRIFRTVDGTSGQPEPMEEEEWMVIARDNVIDVDLAVTDGFHTANAYYWTEV